MARATQNLFQKQLSPVTDQTISHMKKLHPPSLNTSPPLPSNAPTFHQVDLDTLSKIVRKSLSNGSSPAGSGWTGDILIPLVGDKDCLAGLGILVRDIISGTLPDSCRTLLLSSILIAADKDNGGIRPIAMGEAFYKIASLYVLSLVRDDIPSILEPIQLGLSPGGSEAAHHVLQAAVDLHLDWVVISTDISNAFNTRSRSQILSTLFKEVKLAPLWRLVHWSYGSSSPLLLMNQGKVITVLNSEEGVKQGDNLGSLLFALSMKDIYSDSIHGLDCHAVSIMDNFYIFGTPLQAVKALTRFESALTTSHTGLTLNIDKSLALGPNDSKVSDLFIQRHIHYDTKLLPALGGVIGRSRPAITHWLEDNAPQLHQSLFDSILDPALPSQHAYSLLRMCILPRMNYWSRVFPPEVFSSTAKAFDKVVLDTFTHKLLLPTLGFVALEQLSLPISLGGVWTTFNVVCI